jgi:hypothetical protein
MMDKFQRALARFVALAAILIGATIALMLAAVTLVAGLVVGATVAVAAWFGLRASRRAVPGGRGSAGRARDLTVIDIEMRELQPGEQSRAATGRFDEGSRPGTGGPRR